MSARNYDEEPLAFKAASLLPEWSWDVLRLCEEYKDRGVVGIDIAGDEGSSEGETFYATVGWTRSEKKKI